MADPIKPTDAEKAELEAYRAKEKREKLIQAEIAKRSAICQGMIPEKMLREVAERQIDHDAKLAAESK